MRSREHYDRLLQPLLGRANAYARSILRNRHNSEDAVQQAAMRGWERFGTFDRNRSFKAWWFAILHNCCIDIIRASSALRTTALAPEVIDEATSSDDAWLQLAGALARLSEDHREILRLKYFADQSYDEIAQTLSIPKGTVMSRLHLARKALAAKMSVEES
jgi:RNA polymerase sigma-70 factor (ECF subfamily)